MEQLLATYTNGRANIVIVGRNQAAADRIVASFPEPPYPNETNSITVKHEFIQCDVSFISNVRVAVEEIKKRYSKINMLVCSAGALAMSQKITTEGLDESHVLRTYARTKFIYELQPLLSNDRAAGEDARAMIILNAATSNKVDLEDLDIKKFSMISVMGERHPDLAFIHIFPGGTDMPGLHKTWYLSLAATRKTSTSETGRCR
ncbi:SubName: Full=Uncharacterized protein {ECO:0000313/EMBL:CCA68908.1}, partial [Serendipita indica DSM 11827]